MTTTREAALEAALNGCIAAIEHADMSEGVCCCGDNMEGHSDPMNCGHSPVDMGEYHAHQVLKAARAALSTPATEPQGYVDPYRAHGSKQIMPRVSPGLYVAHWASGGSSEVSIGMGSSGDNWIAPTNWIAPAMIYELEAKGSWGELDRLEALAARPAPQPAAETALAFVMQPNPLFDAMPFQPAADTRVVVKPLVWVPEDAPCTRFKAEALGGHMMIVELDPETHPGTYSVGFDLGGLCFKFVLAEYDDFLPKYTAPAKFEGIEAAKAAAQADYETRVLSAIIGNATPAPSDKIAEAAQVIIAKWDADTKTGLVYGPNEFAVMLRALAGKVE